MTELSNSQIRQIMVRHKVEQVMRPEYIPPEAQNGKSGVDPTTELTGFKRDFDVLIQAALETFPRGTDKNTFAQYLTDTADRQGQTSAGPYLRATLLEIRDIVAPDFLKQKPAASAGLGASDAIGALKQAHMDRDSWDILTQVEEKLAGKGASSADVARELKNIGDGHQQSGDDFLAETSDILRATLKKVEQSHAAQPAKPAAPAKAALKL